MAREQRTARLTILIDPDKKSVFEHLCSLEDVTPSQVVRRLIREFIEQQSGRPWKAGDLPEDFAPTSSAGTEQQGKREDPAKDR
jgi:hypothetical protein